MARKLLQSCLFLPFNKPSTGRIAVKVKSQRADASIGYSGLQGKGKHMKIEEAARLLRDMYNTAPPGEKAVSIHLFGIKYADEIRSMSPEEVAARAEVPVSYGTEIRKAINLAKYVELKER